MTVFDHYGLEPENVQERLESIPVTANAHVNELYDLAETHFEKYQELFYEEKLVDEALYELESAEELVSRAEVDIQMRDGSNSYFVPGDEL